MKTRHKPTAAQRYEKRLKRAELRAAAARKVEALREWRAARAQAANDKAREAAAARNAQPRGVDRVPAHLDGNPLQRNPRPTSAETRQQRRQAERQAEPKQRGDEVTLRDPTPHRRPPRRRFMPAAEARCLERARKQWLAAQDGPKS
ncbi:hypothetical protein [Nocardioides sp.]|uniref:hypothetical protein n=1 Tax=Nocardioides sp. TaxID=35761 RepID=UPI00260B2C3A|nr:hypothetical protein [Nocardioides sp.]MDI6911453.1 hypothetical protein [Nocardioides sp.]